MGLFNRNDENLINRLIDDASAFIVYTDANGNISLYNKKVESIADRQKDSLIGKNWLDLLYHSENNEMKQQMFKAVIEDSLTYKRANTFEDVINEVNNQERFICWNITPILSDNSEPEGILFIGSDITELKEREASFKKIDETLKNIFASIKEYALYVANLDGNITYYGMGSEAMFGWQKNEIVFKHIGILHTEEDAKSKLPLILEQTERYGRHEEVEINLVKKNKETVPAILTVTRLLDPAGKLSGYIFMAKDITERKKLEFQIFQSEKLAAIGQLAAGMAHEISNPLFVISGRLEMLFREGDLIRKIEHDLKIINEQTDRIRKVVDRLLKFARSSRLEFETVNVNEAIDTALPFLSYQKLLGTKIKIEKSYTRDLAPVKADLNQLQEVFVNILMNACQAMPGGGTITITTKNLPNRFIEIRLSDTGTGIPKDKLKNIFIPFFTTKGDGTGLGLSICYTIIKNHNGFIEIDTLDNKGTAFIIKLPFA